MLAVLRQQRLWGSRFRAWNWLWTCGSDSTQSSIMPSNYSFTSKYDNDFGRAAAFCHIGYIICERRGKRDEEQKMRDGRRGARKMEFTLAQRCTTCGFRNASSWCRNIYHTSHTYTLYLHGSSFLCLLSYINERSVQRWKTNTTAEKENSARDARCTRSRKT